ncbi:hypothetical protein BYT27DRAFT_7188052 [Phlegmacium glaucopus]|nr:hypothetical protein BYT27DRAFT_7188052 [Phlegmacium glaucopus]
MFTNRFITRQNLYITVWSGFNDVTGKSVHSHMVLSSFWTTSLLFPKRDHHYLSSPNASSPNQSPTKPTTSSLVKQSQSPSEAKTTKSPFLNVVVVIHVSAVLFLTALLDSSAPFQSRVTKACDIPQPSIQGVMGILICVDDVCFIGVEWLVNHQ